MRDWQKRARSGEPRHRGKSEGPSLWQIWLMLLLIAAVATYVGN
jgi:hypothetical protein